MTQDKNILWPSELSVLSEDEKKSLTDKHLQSYKVLLSHESIPTSDTNINLLTELYIPFTHWLAQQSPRPFVLGINGAQGSGKTTFTKIIQQLLTDEYGKSVVSISIDDLYLTKAERINLSETVHPLLATRGVPGTHDIELGTNILQRLKKTNGAPLSIPTFNKALDDRNKQDDWQSIDKCPDIILFEGWCVGATAEHRSSLLEPINTLEAHEDASGQWREYVNKQLKGGYARCFSEIDELIMLKIPSYNKVLEWRTLQENKLKKSVRHSSGQYTCMSEQEIKRFIMFFERITRNTLKAPSSRARFIFEIDTRHSITRTHYNQ